MAFSNATPDGRLEFPASKSGNKVGERQAKFGQGILDSAH
jgi:hypothetical protein